MTSHTTAAQDDALRSELWDALAKDRTVMLGSVDAAVTARPMTAQVDGEGDGRTMYFFASRDEGIGREMLAGKDKAHLTFQSKDHGIMAAGECTLRVVEDAATIDRLWSVFASLYYDNGKRDPNLLLLRAEPGTFDVWRNSTGGFLKAVAYKLMGRDAGTANPEDRGTVAL